MNIRDVIIDMIQQSKRAAVVVAPESNLYTDLGFDSLAFVKLLVRVEEACQISLTLMEMAECLQVDRMIAIVEAKVEGAAHDTILATKPEKS